MAEDQFFDSLVDASPSSYAQSSMKQSVVQRSKSDSNLKNAEHRENKLSSVSLNGGPRAGRHRSEDLGQTTSRRNSSFEIFRMRSKAANGGATPQQRRTSVFKKFKENMASRKRLSLQIPDIKMFGPSSSSLEASEMVRRSSSGYGSVSHSVGSRSPEARFSGEASAVNIDLEGIATKTRSLKRHSLDVGALARVNEDVMPPGSTRAVTFHLGPVTPEVDTVSSGASFNLKTESKRKRLSLDLETTSDGLTTKKSGLSKVLNNVTKRNQKNFVPDGVINVAFTKAATLQTSIIIGSDEIPGIDGSENDADSDGFVDEDQVEDDDFDDDNEDDDDDDDDYEEVYREPTLSPVNPKLSTARALRKKRKKILSQTEDVSIIY